LKSEFWNLVGGDTVSGAQQVLAATRDVPCETDARLELLPISSTLLQVSGIANDGRDGLSALAVSREVGILHNLAQIPDAFVAVGLGRA
jgi:hypothetical protein